MITARELRDRISNDNEALKRKIFENLEQDLISNNGQAFISSDSFDNKLGLKRIITTDLKRLGDTVKEVSSYYDPREREILGQNGIEVSI